MATVEFEDITFLKILTELAKPSKSDFIPITITSSFFSVEMFNVSRSVYFEFRIQKEYFKTFDYSKQISFHLPIQFFSHLINEVCFSSDSLIIEVKRTKVCFHVRNMMINVSLELNNFHEIMLKNNQMNENCNFKIKAKELIKAIRTIWKLQQPQTLFRIKKDGIVQLIGSGNTDLSDCIQEFLEVRAETNKDIDVLFNTSLLFEFICVDPPMEEINIYLNEKYHSSFQYKNDLVNLEIVISSIDEE